MLTDDQPSHPMAFVIRLVFSGELDRRAFADAVRIALERHPLLTAHVRRRGWRGLEWVPAADPSPRIDYGSPSDPPRFPGAERIDLGSSTGLRIWARAGGDRTEIHAQFHHACCDGVGAYRFLEDLLVAYHRTVGRDGATPTFRPVDPGLLRQRGRLGPPWPRALLRLPIELAGCLIALLGFLLIRPAPLASPGEPALDDDAPLVVPDYPSYSLDREGSADLLKAARVSGATINDVILRDMFVTMHAWNSRHDATLWRRALRIAVPFNLRGPDGASLPAANAVAMCFLDRHPGRFRDSRRALRAIARETRVLKRLRAPLTFIRGVSLMSAIPGALAMLSRANRCYATAVFTNMGEVFAGAPLSRRDGRLIAGRLVLEEVHSAPPVRSLTSVALNLLSYAGRMTLDLNYDRRCLTAAAAGRLLGELVQQLRPTVRAFPAGDRRPRPGIVDATPAPASAEVSGRPPRTPSGLEPLPAWSGVTVPVWLGVMRRHRYPVSYDRLAHFLVPTIAAPINSLAAVVQRLVFRRRIDAVILDAPVVIVGFMRTGTTLLHELLASDPRHTAPTMYQCMAPEHFLVTRFLGAAASYVLPRRRAMDEMKFGVDRPFEDDFALCLLGLDSPYRFFFFPLSDQLTRDDDPPETGPEAERWRRGFIRFLKAVLLARPGRLVLKSPPHTLRVGRLVETLPDVRFVHMTRDPLAVVPSAIHTVRQLVRTWGLQPVSDVAIEEWVFRYLERAHRRWDADRALLAPDRHVEVRYENLIADPIPILERVYATLGLGAFAPARSAVERYLAEVAGYRPNRFAPDEGLRRRILERCGWMM